MVSEEEREEWWAERAAKATPSPRFAAAESSAMRRLLMSKNSPGGGYILAKDECSWYTGPAWVPFNVWQAAEYGGNSPLERDCAKRLIESAGAEKLWPDMAERYARHGSITISLSAVCAEALAAWRLMPKDKPKDFVRRRKELARKSEQISKELETFFLHRDADEHEWPGLLDFMQLMSDEERERFDQAIRVAAWSIASRALRDAGQDPPTWGDYNNDREGTIHSDARLDAWEIYPLLLPDHTQPHELYGGVPTLPDMMRRISAKFDEDGDEPPLRRPLYKNAERNFFARQVCKYFWQSHADISPSIVASIVSMFYTQGIDEVDVSQIASRVKRSHPLLTEPENSIDK
mgnify:CR=1 FL=1